jgi:hypothetical protein
MTEEGEYNHILNAKSINHIKTADLNAKKINVTFDLSRAFGIFKRRDLENTILNIF